jgi:uncharacterized protein (DUF2336 family)
MRVLVCGGRDFSDWFLLRDTLTAMHEATPFSLLIHGAAPGADTLAETWAATKSVPTQRFVAFWHTEGRAAGPIRNQRMLDEGKPELVVAFPGGKGTADMVARAEKAGVPVRLPRAAGQN